MALSLKLWDFQLLILWALPEQERTLIKKKRELAHSSKEQN
jgi:hypothetical protein